MLNKTVIERIPPGFLILLQKEGPERLACVAPWWFLALVQELETIPYEIKDDMEFGFYQALAIAVELEMTQAKRMYPGRNSYDHDTPLQTLVNHKHYERDALQAAALEEPEFALLCRDHVLDADTRTKCIYLAGDL